jgi:hypothetical protein
VSGTSVCVSCASGARVGEVLLARAWAGLCMLALVPALPAQQLARPAPIERLVAVWQRDLARFSATTLSLHAEIGVEPFAPTCNLSRYGHVVDANRH